MILFDVHNPRHIRMVNWISESFKDQTDMKLVSLGNRMQAVFKDNRYVMTIDWKLI